MKRQNLLPYLFIILIAAGWLAAQDTLPIVEPQLPTATPQTTQVQVQPQPAAQQTQTAKADALVLFRQGRDLELKGKKAEAIKYYQDAIAVCDMELAKDAARMDAYTIKCWSLFRLEQYRQVIDVGNTALKVRYDTRIVETMGEAYYFLNDFSNCLRSMQNYINNTTENADRVSTAYFYMAETYVRLQKYEHADIAYAMAVYKEPSMVRWWFRYAQVVEKLEDHVRAYALYTKVLQMSPANKEAQEGLARAKSKM